MSTVQVLCPNGRRQNVKVTPNTKLLQVLEEVCKKQGFLPPEDFTLKHGRKPVDVTLSLRYSNLPNNVKLELVKSESSRAEQDVLIALQLEDGQRLQHTFPPATSLWDILQHWENADSIHKGNLCKVDPSTKPPTQTTCIYMREEIIGEIALQSMTLRKLGLTGGKAVIRLVHRPVDDSIMAEILDKIEREKTKLQKLDLMAQRQLSQQEEKSEDPIQSKEAQSEDKSSIAENKTEEPKNSASRTSEAMEVDAKQSASVPSTSQQQQPMEVEDKIETEGHRAMATGQGCGQSNQQQDFAETIRQMNIPGVQVFSPGDFHELSAQEQEVARCLAAHYMPLMGLQPSPDQQTAASGSKPKRGRPQEAPMFSEFKFPEETKGKEVYKNELSEVNREEYKPCDRQAVLFNAEETTRATASNECQDLPDEFFEINENDIRKMMVDLQKKVEADQPLLTRTMIQERLESKYAKYQQVVVRVQFPDKVVLQGLFRPKETVHALHKFVRGHLEDKSLKFYLYTAPPKQVLKDQTLTLIQAKLAPASVVYFGSETTKDHYLSEAVMKEIGPKSKAEDIVENCLPKDNTSTSARMDSNPGPSKPKPSKPASNASGDPKKPGVPKWFTVGKK